LPDLSKANHPADGEFILNSQTAAHREYLYDNCPGRLGAHLAV
jgi:hypothetical protein